MYHEDSLNDLKERMSVLNEKYAKTREDLRNGIQDKAAMIEYLLEAERVLKIHHEDLKAFYQLFGLDLTLIEVAIEGLRAKGELPPSIT